VAPHEIVVFLGPSLPHEEARRLLPACYLGPARCGDVLRARRLTPRVIALVDGVFATTPATWHKELLLALEDGIAVFGASSMGALRAAELAPFGMIGLGRIFAAYRDGVYTDDDEVALLHGPAESGYRELSEAMVNIRATVEHAVACDVIDPDSASRIIRRAKDTFYQERSLGAAIDWAWAGDPHAREPQRLRRFLAQGGRVNQKRLDAMELLRHLAAGDTAPAMVRPRVHRTSFIVKLHYETACRPFVDPPPNLPLDEQVGVAAGALGRLAPLVRRLAQLLAIADALGSRLSIDRSRLAFDVPLRLARVEAVVADHARRHGRRTRYIRRRHLLDLMRLDGRYGRFRTGRMDGGEVGLYERIADLWTIVDEQLDAARVEMTTPLQDLSDAFRRTRRLERRADALAWRRANDLDGRGYERVVATDARLTLVTSGAEAHAVGLLPATDPACWLADAARVAGMYDRLVRRASGGKKEERRWRRQPKRAVASGHARRSR
jgi:hypothetical protein